MTTGIVKFFNASKGFGFVTPEGGSTDIFLPAAAVTASGLTVVKPGQRVTFEQAPDAKGPKIVSLKVVADAPAKLPVPPVSQVTVYGDGGADSTAEVVDALRELGFAVTMRDYVATPASTDELKRLSQTVSASGQSLVRRYDSLFLGLQLDDRFITDQDFWTAISQHPVLINGPVVMVAGSARICRTAGEVRAFLKKSEPAVLPKPKTLTPRIVSMLRGEAVPRAVSAPSIKSPEPAPAPTKKVPAAQKPTAKTEPAAKPKGKTVVKPKPAKAPAKKSAAKKIAKPPKKTKKRAGK
jgi:cold shock protein